MDSNEVAKDSLYLFECFVSALLFYANESHHLHATYHEDRMSTTTCVSELIIKVVITP